ncbi:glycoside hydrolase 100 family protein [bacterium]
MIRDAGLIDKVKKAALNVLLHNRQGPYQGLPRTAGWGYPEPYTRDLMIASLGILASGNDLLIASLKNVLQTLAGNQSQHGHIPSLIHDPEDRGASDTTPLFLLALGLYRKVTGETDFLQGAAGKALVWMDYQSPDDRVLVGQLPTSDWRDEQWVTGYGLFVNTVVFAYLPMYGQFEKAKKLHDLMGRFVVRGEAQHKHVHEGLVLPHLPYYAMSSYKMYRSNRFDLLGNSLAMLTGLTAPSRADALISWIENENKAMRIQGDLKVDLPPVLFPYIQQTDPDWRPRYDKYNRPGEYHNGGVWPYVCGFYVAALVKSGHMKLAKKRFIALTRLNCLSSNPEIDFGFNEWIKAQTGKPVGQDWQTWSAAMYLYAAACIETGKAVFFE